MKIEYWTDSEKLIPLLKLWYAQQQCDSLGIDANIDIYVKDMNKWLGNLGGVILAAIDKDELVGFLALITAPSEFGDQVWSYEKGWYVKPETNGAALRLYKKAEKWSRDKGCSHFVMTASNAASGLHDKVCRFYRRMGMKKFETSFIKDI